MDTFTAPYPLLTSLIMRWSAARSVDENLDMNPQVESSLTPASTPVENQASRPADKESTSAADKNTCSKSSHKAHLHKPQNGEIPDIDAAFFRYTMIDEICALRRDVETLRLGGWKSDACPSLDAADEGVATGEALRARISAGIRPSSQSRPHASSTIASESVENLRAAPNSASTTLPKSDETGNSSASAIPAQVTSTNDDDNASTHRSRPIATLVDRSSGSAAPWQPSFVRELAPLKDLRMPPPSKTTTFSLDFLTSTFGGVEWSPGLYHTPKSAGPCILPSRSYYAINATHEPYLPTRPGTHGAKLTAFFNNVESNDVYANFPLFVSAVRHGDMRFKNNEYVYFGTYSQTRWSDKLDYDSARDRVPKHVKNFWAEQLADPARPAWVTTALMKQFVPMPQYEGVLPNTHSNGSLTNSESDLSSQLDNDVRSFVEDLRAWEKEAGIKVSLLKKEHILNAFESSDVDDPPGLRLWWEYLQCVDWDEKFYAMLVTLQEKRKSRR